MQNCAERIVNHIYILCMQKWSRQKKNIHKYILVYWYASRWFSSIHIYVLYTTCHKRMNWTIMNKMCILFPCKTITLSAIWFNHDEKLFRSFFAIHFPDDKWMPPQCMIKWNNDTWIFKLTLCNWSSRRVSERHTKYIDKTETIFHKFSYTIILLALQQNEVFTWIDITK